MPHALEEDRLADAISLDPEQRTAVMSSRMSLVAKTPGRVATTPNRVKEIRLLRGMSQVRLAMVMGSSPQMVRKAEQGYLAQMRITTVLRMANALGVGSADLFPILRERLKHYGGRDKTKRKGGEAAREGSAPRRIVD